MSGRNAWMRGLTVVVLASCVTAALCPPLPGSPTRAGAQAIEAWAEPVEAPVVDGYRPPAHVGAPGNRGWEYLTEPGSAVLAAGVGVVGFAGRIGPHLYVSIVHADGRSTTYSYVGEVIVEVGMRVRTGDQIAVASDRLHFGLRDGAEYLDPGQLFGGATETGEGVRLVARPGSAVLGRVASSFASTGRGWMVAVFAQWGRTTS